MRVPQKETEQQAGPSRGVGGVWDRLARWVFRASVVGFAVSMLAHLALALLAAGIVVAVAGEGSGGDVLAADAGLEVLSETELTSLEAADLKAEDIAPQALTEQQAPLVDLASAPANVSGGAATGDTSGLSGPGMGGAGDVSGIGDGSSLGGAGGGGAKFFGVEAVGSRFAYICDVSGSMAGPKLQALKDQLNESVDGLLERSSFHIVLFSSEARPLMAQSKWTEAGSRQKRLAKQAIEAITAGGSTNPAPAFEDVFRLRPRPDAIYFMTDGLFALEVADQVRQLNNSGGRIVPVHCIAFVSREAEDLLKQIAADSDGSYTFVGGPGP
jgi:hypothetical protein